MKELVDQFKKLLERIRQLEANTYKKDVMVVPKVASDPASPVNGQLWYNSTTNVFKCYQNGAVKTFTTS